MNVKAWENSYVFFKSSNTEKQQQQATLISWKTKELKNVFLIFLSSSHPLWFGAIKYSLSHKLYLQVSVNFLIADIK